MSLLNQARDGYKLIIQMNPAVASRWVYPMKQNSLGETVRDLDGTPVLFREVVRISHERGSVPANSAEPTGLDTNYSMFIMLFHDSVMQEGEIINVSGKGWKAGPVDSLLVSGEVYGKRSTLFPAEMNSGKDIETAYIGTVEGIKAGSTITFELPIGTVVTALAPVFTINGVLISPVTAQDFTAPIEYTVTAQNFETKKYTVGVVLI